MTAATPGGRRACLHQRGFDLRKIEHLPLGYFPAVEPLWRCLLHDGFAADEIRASNLLADSRLPGRLIGPIRVPIGESRAFGRGSRRTSTAVFT